MTAPQNVVALRHAVALGLQALRAAEAASAATLCPGGDECSAARLPEGTPIDSAGTTWPGHLASDIARRGTVPHPAAPNVGYAHSPERCPHVAETRGVWVADPRPTSVDPLDPDEPPTALVCRGCGLDCT